jgi:16S rRNA (adenine1518-N6/adenine1519-N6)-dimethyltransferase
MSKGRPKKRFGQHFLEPAWADKVVDVIEPAPTDRFLEIGPGPGALTLRLAPRVAHITAVEVDPAMIASLRPKLPPNVELVHRDFLEFDLAAVAANGALRVAGNLPYNVSSPILVRLLQASRLTRHLTDASVMLQYEVADRVAAGPGSREYGVLSILVQLYADVRRLLTLPPGAFRPMPEVRSAVVRLTFHAPLHEVPNPETFEALVRSMFMQRRKTLLNALRPFAATRGRQPGPMLELAQIDGRRRPETLTLAEIARLSRAVGSVQT